MEKKFYQLSPNQRRDFLKEKTALENLAQKEVSLEKLNQLSENVIGKLTLPLSVVNDVQINQQKFVVPMATEEPSVVAAANHGIQIFNRNQGVETTSQRAGIYGQAIFEIDESFDLATFEKELPDLITDLNSEFASLVKHGGGVKEITAQINNSLLELRLLVDPAESMGANKTNSILESMSQQLQDYPGIVAKLFAILSNYPSQFASAKVRLDFATLTKKNDAELGKQIARKIVLLSDFGRENIYRATTNNKGIMNGVDAVLLATGNDYRAVEAAVGVYASRDGQYRSLSNWSIENNQLVGELTLPLAIGVVGGSIKVRADIQEAYQILGHPKVATLAELMVTIGLANNFAALLAISTKGIQAGHMKLQAKNLALEVGATLTELPQVVAKLIAENSFSRAQAREILQELRSK